MAPAPAPAILREVVSAAQLDMALLAERHRAVLVRFGRKHDPICAAMDVLLQEIAHEVCLYSVILLVDVEAVPEFTDVYELYDPCTLRCFFRNKPLYLDVGYGLDTRVTWGVQRSQDLADAVVQACRRKAQRNNSAGGNISRLFHGLFMGQLW